jgi:hypothetical protein
MSIDERSPLACLDGRAQRMVRAARAYADTLRSPVIGAEHLLLALLTDRRCRAARAVAALSDRAARAVGEPLVPGDRPSPRHLAFTITSEQAMVRRPARPGLSATRESGPSICCSACSGPPTTRPCGGSRASM